jgi:7,8-dihydropterin-6-yl-methyl-4-(beta-D-ribofuranosyl)aminobenzene 5'-phosphate synthase
VVISHGHSDHTGGLLNFFKINDNAPVYLKKEAFNPHYAKRISKKEFIGIDTRIIKNYSERFKFVEKTSKILRGVFIIPQILKKFPIPTNNRYLFSLKGDQFVRDQFNHEIFMAVQNNDMTVFSGCGHNGIRNIIYTAKEMFPDKKIRKIVGGFHFQAGKSTSVKAKDEEILETAKWLKCEGLGKIYTGHCTGSHGFKIMRTVLGDDLMRIYSGQKILL